MIRRRTQLKRTPLRKVGRKKPKESIVLPEHEEMLNTFWRNVACGFRTHDFILAEMVKLAAVGGRKRAARNHFHRLKKIGLFAWRGKQCVCCPMPAELSHHLIQLQHGGPNHKLNVAPCCNECHCKIHPHLREKS